MTFFDGFKAFISKLSIKALKTVKNDGFLMSTNEEIQLYNYVTIWLMNLNVSRRTGISVTISKYLPMF